MYRVLIPAILASLLTGCGMANSSISSGFADSGQPTSALPTSRTMRSSADGDGGGGDTSTRPQKVAAASEDRIPKGTFEKAPNGALADRDYSITRLDPERARDLINAYRKEKGLKPLKLNTALTEAAKNHSRDLAKWDRISHYGSDGSNPWDRVKRVGYNAKVTAENVGTGQVTVDEVMKGWQNSPGHNKNLLLTDASDMGIALVQDNKTEFKTFWTLVVGSPQ
jgi:uncharacterized protein YkwD